MKRLKNSRPALHSVSAARVLIIAVTLIAALAAFGCKSAYMSSASVASISVPDQEVTDDVKLAVSAIVARMQGGAPVDHVSFQGQSASRLAESGFSYEGFALMRNTLLNDVFVSEDTRRLGGYLFFEDTMGRNTSVAFDTQYTIVDDGIAVTQAAISQALSQDPDVKLFVLPGDPCRDKLPALSTYEGFFDLARQYAIASGSPEAAAAGEQDYVLLALVRDRIGPEDKIHVLLSERTGSTGYKTGATVLDFNGWRVGIGVYNLALFSSKPVYVKVTYTGKDTGKKLIGNYSIGKQ